MWIKAFIPTLPTRRCRKWLEFWISQRLLTNIFSLFTVAAEFIYPWRADDSLISNHADVSCHYAPHRTGKPICVFYDYLISSSLRSKETNKEADMICLSINKQDDGNVTLTAYCPYMYFTFWSCIWNFSSLQPHSHLSSHYSSYFSLFGQP